MYMKMDQQLQLQQIISRVISEYGEVSSQEKTAVQLNPVIVVEKAQKAQKKLIELSLKQRSAIVESIKEAMSRQGEAYLQTYITQTQMGNIADKRINLDLILKKTPCQEALVATVNTGDEGLTLNEYSPYGVIAAILPLSNLVELIINSTIGMVSAGNAVVFCAPDESLGFCQELIASLNQIVVKAGGPDFLLCALGVSQSQELVKLDEIDMVIVTGKSDANLVVPLGKKTIVTGDAHAPVIVDETADIEQAAKDIVMGAGFDYNQSFIAEKALVAVDSIADFLLHHLVASGAYVITQETVLQRLESLLLEAEEGAPCYCGRSAGDILYLLGINEPNARLIVVPLDNMNHPFIQKNLMAPVLPMVRAKNVHRAIVMAKDIEKGMKHTAIMHSKHIDYLTACARELQVVMFIKNAPSYAGLGLSGEGFTSFMIAAKTGEGPICAQHFSRARRCVLSEGFLIK